MSFRMEALAVQEEISTSINHWDFKQILKFYLGSTCQLLELPLN